MKVDNNTVKELWLDTANKSWKVTAVTVMLLFLFLSLDLFGQDHEDGYYRIVEIRARVDALGNIHLKPLVRKKSELTDGLLDEVNSAIYFSHDHVIVLNILSKKKWELVSVSQALSNSFEVHGSSLILYYIRKYVKGKPENQSR